ncbi:hypothetical protein ACIQU5_32745 [Streptomyces sp. NPDC090306]
MPEPYEHDILGNSELFPRRDSQLDGSAKTGFQLERAHLLL